MSLKSKLLETDNKDIFDANIKSKQSGQDKTKKLDGKAALKQTTTVLQTEPMNEPSDTLPDYGKDVTKDTSTPTKTAKVKEPPKKLVSEDETVTVKIKDKKKGGGDDTEADDSDEGDDDSDDGDGGGGDEKPEFDKFKKKGKEPTGGEVAEGAEDEVDEEAELLAERQVMKSGVLKTMLNSLKQKSGSVVAYDARKRAVGDDLNATNLNSKLKTAGHAKLHGSHDKDPAITTNKMVKEEDEVAFEIPDTLIDMSEHVNALFEGEELSDAFKAKAKTIFETAVAHETSAIFDEITEAAIDSIYAEVAVITEQYEDKIKDVLGYVVEQWIESNKVAIEASLKSELTEDFLMGLKQLFETHYIDIPDDKIDMVSEMAEKVAELEERLNEEMEKNIAFKKAINEGNKKDIVAEMSEGLTVVDASKFKALCEEIDTDEEGYEDRVKTIRESYFKKGAAAPKGKVIPTEVQAEVVLTEAQVDAEAKLVTDEKKPASLEMRGYVAALAATKRS